jgi:hypothetical protein
MPLKVIPLFDEESAIAIIRLLEDSVQGGRQPLVCKRHRQNPATVKVAQSRDH